MASERTVENAAELCVVTVFEPTPNGKVRLFRMQHGHRVVLDTIEDQWETNDVEDFCDQLLRVETSDALMAHMEAVRQPYIEEFSKCPLYQERAKRDPDFWKWWRSGRVR